ncbi:MAG TPA: DNA recombination protein RmuC [Gaiellaceae bacterium]|jgi:DNA recombination protein RmuC|nr:DNA recombination protein RmuC [Gaiellaceae bacterium]
MVLVVIVLVTALGGLAVGALAAWLLLSPRLVARERDLAVATAELELERRAIDQKLVGAVKAASEEAYQASNTAFLELAETKLSGYVQPLKESLAKVDGQVRTLEQARQHAFGALKQELATLRDGQDRLRSETGNLVTALRAPHVRGRWGEIQLKRVVEAAGMIEHCDFVLQSTTRDDEGGLLRPDLIVKLPGGKHVVVDAKVPLAAYLDACGCDGADEQQSFLKEHARQLRDHIGKLSAKTYWRQFEPTPDFVIMFLPDEAFLRAAHEHDSGITEDAWRLNVVPASPTNLFALLRTVAATWQQETVAESAREVHGLGQQLCDRLVTMAGHIDQLGRSLTGAVGHYNKTVRTLESRVLVTGRRLQAHGMSGDRLPALQPIEVVTDSLSAKELVESLDDGLRAIDAA